jgi:hypothetical protein
MDHGGNANVIALALRCYNRDDITFSSIIPPVPQSIPHEQSRPLVFFSPARTPLFAANWAQCAFDAGFRDKGPLAWLAGN